MREILFRGKQIDNGQWVEGYYIKYETRQCCPLGNDKLEDNEILHLIARDGFADWNMPRQLTFTKIDKETVGEFTGLTDKNGVKIFEGDTIRWSEWQGTGLPNGEEELAIEDYLVEFINGMFVAKCLLSRFPTHCLLTEFDLKEGKLIDAEVFGNIHDKEVTK